MGVLWPKSGSFEFDDSGDRAIGAKAYFYEPGTSTPKPVYDNGDESGTPYTQPVTADGYGRWPAVFIPFGTSEAYKVLITDSGGSTLIAIDDIPNPAPTDPGEGVDANAIFQTGDMILVGKNGTRTGFVRCNGRSIGSASSSATERANADCEDLFEFVWNNYADGQCAVSSGRGASAAADFAANKRITLPDYRSASLIGFDDMGNSAASLAGSAPVVSGSAILAGSLIGANTHTLATSEAPAHTHSVSITTDSQGAHTHTATTSSDGAHTHSVTIASGQGSHQHTVNGGNSYVVFVASGGTLGLGGGTNGFTVPTNDLATLPEMSGTAASNGAHTHTLTTSSNGAHTHSVSGTSGSTGGGTAHNNMARSAPVTVLMKL